MGSISGAALLFKIILLTYLSGCAGLAAARALLSGRCMDFSLWCLLLLQSTDLSTGLQTTKGCSCLRHVGSSWDQGRTQSPVLGKDLTTDHQEALVRTFLISVESLLSLDKGWILETGSSHFPLCFLGPGKLRNPGSAGSLHRYISYKGCHNKTTYWVAIPNLFVYSSGGWGNKIEGLACLDSEASLLGLQMVAQAMSSHGLGVSSYKEIALWD